MEKQKRPRMSGQKGREAMNRKHITPEPGRVYTLKSNNSIITSLFRCLEAQSGVAVMQNLASGWTFKAHGVGQYDDGEIDWDYSTGGYFMNETEI